MGEKGHIPELRFKVFNDQWNIYSLQYLLEALIDCEHKTAPYIEDSEFLVVRTNNVKNGQLDYADIKYTTAEGFREWTKRAIPKYGEILFTREAPAGESCLVPENKKVCLGQRIVLLRPNENRLSGQYLSVYLQSNKAFRSISILSIGTTVTRINIADIYKINCPTPSLPEQQKIADFLSSVDKKIQSLSRKKELLEQYKKGVMQKIFPAKGRQAPEIRFKKEDGSDYPEWEEKRLGEIYKFYRNNSFSRENLNYIDGDIFNIHYGDIHTKFKSNFKLKEELVPLINKNIDISGIKEADFIMEGDLVIADASEDYADIGKSIEVVSNDNMKIVAGLHTFLARPSNSTIHLGFGAILMQSWNIRYQLMRIAQGTKVMSISKGRMDHLFLKIPSLKEQEKIVRVIGNLENKTSSISSQIDKTQTWKKGLLQKMFV